MIEQNRTVNFFFYPTPQAIDFKIQCSVINLHLEINCSTDQQIGEAESEKPVLATCSQLPQTI